MKNAKRKQKCYTLIYFDRKENKWRLITDWFLKNVENEKYNRLDIKSLLFNNYLLSIHYLYASPFYGGRGKVLGVKNVLKICFGINAKLKRIV